MDALMDIGSRPKKSTRPTAAQQRRHLRSGADGNRNNPTTMKTDTPRTDEIAHAGLDSDTYTSRMTGLARELERENARMQMELDTSERELKERGVDIQELTTALRSEREENATAGERG
jgi:hypothetical protein